MSTSVLNNERELLTELSKGSEKAFEEIYRFYSLRLFGKMIKLLKSEALASELLQDVFLKLWELRQSIDQEKCFRSYLFRIAINKSYDCLRRSVRSRKIQQELIKTSSEEEETIEETVYSEANFSLLNQAISLLPPQRQQIFRLCKLEGKSYKEVSSMLCISTSTISDHIVKANNYIKSHFFTAGTAYSVI